MALLSVQDQADLQSAIDLMLKGTARETPFADDVIERLLPIIRRNGAPAGVTDGAFKEQVRDTPYSILIALVAEGGSEIFTDAQADQVLSAYNLMHVAQAYETPFAEDVIERLAPVAEATGFLTKGGFYEAIRDRPISTMLQWALLLGSR